MWDGLFMLLSLSIVMAAASFLAGILPLAFTLSSRQLRLITAVGTGVLVGTSLIVIIPEGIETLYAAREVQHTHTTRSNVLNARAVPAWAVRDLTEYQEHGFARRMAPLSEPLHIVESRQEHKLTGPDDGFPEDAETDVDLVNKPAVTEEKEHEEWEPHAWVGISLIAGFILMYLIDKVPRHASGSSQPKPSYISLNRFTLRRTGTQNEEEEDENDFPPPEGQQSSRPSSTTVGLVIHAAADGIALGASSSGSSSNRLGLVVFLALMIHKAPAAFGLTSALLKQGLSKRRARAHLIVFSLAAPTGALLTWSAANMFGGAGGGFSGEEGTQFATGVLLLFSGGTFLYVAMHTMQDTGHSHSTQGTGQNGYTDTNVYDGFQGPAPKQEGPTLTETFACVGGMLLPLLTQFGHVH